MTVHIRQFKINLFILFLLLITKSSFAQANNVTQNDYLEYVINYADCMLTNGRDVYGNEHSPLFAAALDGESMTIGQLPEIDGVRKDDRSLTGANPQHNINLYSILYKLTKITGDKKYADEADKALFFFFKNCASPQTGLLTWGEHLFWDFNLDAQGGDDKRHEIQGEWPFWETCYRLAPEASLNFALGLWQHQIADQKTGDFSRHARWSTHGPGKGSDFPRYAGQMIVTWADAYSRINNQNQNKQTLITAITCIVQRMEDNMKMTETGYLPALRGADYLWPKSNLELARCLEKAAFNMDPPLQKRMLSLAEKLDEQFLNAPHKILTGDGFAATLSTKTGEPRSRSMNKPYTAVWASGYGYGTHAGTANKCYERYLQIHKIHPQTALAYSRLIIAAADQYLTAVPNDNGLYKPDAFANIITLLLNAYNTSKDLKYLDRATFFAEKGITFFLKDNNPLPKASNIHNHYEALTGGPDFMFALMQLYETLVARK